MLLLNTHYVYTYDITPPPLIDAFAPLSAACHMNVTVFTMLSCLRHDSFFTALLLPLSRYATSNGMNNNTRQINMNTVV